MTDDQTIEQLRYLPGVRSILGAEGSTFERAVVSYPKCCPSRATALTGQYTHNHGVLGNGGPFGGVENFNAKNDLPVWLHDSGYRTIHVGHWLAGYGGEDRVTGHVIPEGFDEWHASLDRYGGSWNYRTWEMSHNGAISRMDTGEHQTDYYTRLAVGLIGQEAPKPGPFFLQVWYAAPHTGRPRDPGDPPHFWTTSAPARHRGAFAGARLRLPRGYDERDVSDKPRAIARLEPLSPATHAAIDSARRQALDTLLGVDDSVAAIVEALQRTGDLERTLIVFTSDNGYMNGEHRIPAGKTVPYEPSIRVPLILRGPGVPRGRRDRRLVANIDLAPTILDAAGVRPRLVQDGRSLLPLLDDPGRRLGRAILLEDGHGDATVAPYRGIRTERFTYVRYPRTHERELYDLRRDPGQLRNVAGAPGYAAIEGDLYEELRALKGCRGRDCRRGPRLRLSCRPGRSRVRGHDRKKVVHTDVLRRGRVLARLRDGRRVTLDRRRNCG